MIFKGVDVQIFERLVISMLETGVLETGVLLTNVLSNGDRELNTSNIENCDKDKVESYFKDCSSQMVNQYERCTNCDRLSTEVTAAVKKIDGLYETVNKIFELVCKSNPTLPTI